MNDTAKCKWVVRDGTHNTFWAHTPCVSGFNYLSRINRVEQIKPFYNGRICPICGKQIEINTELVETGELT